MFRKTVGATAGLIGAAVECLEAGVFGGIAANQLPLELFKPLGAMIGATAALGPFAEEDNVKKAIRCLGFLPGAAANVAIFVLEGPTAATLFTVSISASWGLLAAEMIYKRYKGEAISKVDIGDFVIKTGKIASILLTINLGGTGKIFEWAKDGAAPWANRIASAVTTGCAGVGSALGFFRSGKAFAAIAQEKCKKSEESPNDYDAMLEGDLSINNDSTNRDRYFAI